MTKKKMEIIYYKNFFPDWVISGTTTRKFGDVSIRNPAGRKKLEKLLKIKHLACLNQTHSAVIKKVGTKLIPDEADQGDGLWTRERKTGLLIKTADCLPILIADTKAKIIMGLHVGRRNLFCGIINRGLETLLKEKSSLMNLKVFLGPFIEKKCYPTDLETEVRNQLKKYGISNGQVKSSGECTYCLTNKYFSYRRGDSERMGTFIYIDSRLRGNDRQQV
ncbi:MAG: polyphenol oxidase family protein [Patescibacteria group bacterium]|nr:polyphenol oxidase family protein [Patescibacteria group bacterium]